MSLYGAFLPQLDRKGCEELIYTTVDGKEEITVNHVTRNPQRGYVELGKYVGRVPDKHRQWLEDARRVR